MNLIPEVKSCVYNEGFFHIISQLCICIPENTPDYFHAAQTLKTSISSLLGIELLITTQNTDDKKIVFFCNDSSGEGYEISIDSNLVELKAESGRGLFWAVQTLIQIIRYHKSFLPSLSIKDSPDFLNRGFYHDVTRGKVPTLNTLKWLVEKISSYKMNQLQLYVEHSFAFKKIPELWTGKDPLTAEEILELDLYCKKYHVELIPSLATFGHLYELLRLKRFEHLNELNVKASLLPHNLWDRMAHYTIDVSNDESFSLIKSMIEEYLPLFSSRYFNICCDETFDLGKGKNREKAEVYGRGKLYISFVKKIVDLVISHGKVPMLWGDIVLNHPELISELPRDVIFLNWGYTPDVTEDSTKIFASKGVSQYVCPGTTGWSRFINDIAAASQNIRKMARFGRKFQAAGILTTDWGDCGHINPIAGSLHGMALGAAVSWNTNSYEDDSLFDKSLSFLEFDDSSQTVCGLLRDLGSLCFYHFGNLYAWVYGISGLWNKEEQLKNTNILDLEQNYIRAGEIRNELMLSFSGKNNRLVDFKELLWSASAIEWVLGLLIFKKNVEYNQYGNLTLKKDTIIHSGYDILNTFINIWRLRNKESELNNVISTIKSALEKIRLM
ncbi:MAG: family 20 glycosylhydrolase [Fibrobacter sp.]|nr:family 20 glycosylhydrolase [Fibrobacter sp.]